MKKIKTNAPVWDFIKMAVVMAAMMSVFTACNKEGDFVPVLEISDVPTEALIDNPLTLTATILPSNATNQTVVWTVKNAGTTGANITGGNMLTAIAAGTVTVTATIANGATQSTPFTRDFTVSVNSLDGRIEALYQEIEPLADAVLLSENPNWTALTELYKDRGEIKEIEANDNGLLIEFVNGRIDGWLIPPPPLAIDWDAEEMLIRSGAVNLQSASQEKPKVLIIDAASHELRYDTKTSVVLLSNVFIIKGWDVTIKYGDQANVDFFKNGLAGYDVVFVVAHGGVWGDRTWIATGEKVPQSTQDSNKGASFKVLLNQGTIEATTSSYYAVSNKFFVDNYSAQSFSNSMIYMVCCKGLKFAAHLGKTFVDKGAKVVVGWDETNCLGDYSGYKLLEYMLINNCTLNDGIAYLKTLTRTLLDGSLYTNYTYDHDPKHNSNCSSNANLVYYGRDANNAQGLGKGGDYKLPTPEPPPGNNKITMTTQVPHKSGAMPVRIGLIGDGTATVNWGDGTFETKSITVLTVFTSPYDNYTNPHTITITGNNIRYLDCHHSYLASIDVSGLTSLTDFLRYDYPPLTSLNASGCTSLTSININTTQLSSLNVIGCTALTDLRCMYSALTSLDLSGCIALKGWVYLNGNLLSANSLNAMFETLPGNSVSGEIKVLYISCNPGANTCDKSIAQNKGWTVVSGEGWVPSCLGYP